MSATRSAAADAHDIAAEGLTAPGEALPHAGRIQSLFGRHDVSQVTAHVGGAAADASAGLGARAYAAGDHVAFAAPPDLHLAAHEAAHVVQQRAGVALAGGVGAASDAYEQHADAVADLVVQGKSAEALLDERAAGRTHAVQRAVQLAAEDEADAPGRKGVKTDARRMVITFLMGDGDAFYTEATGYWGQSGKTDVLVKDQRTFSAVLEYLRTNPPSNGKPWAEINIVVHAAEEGNMMIKYDQDSHTNISQAELQGKVDKGQVKALDDKIVDHSTNVNVHGCAIGNSAAMLKTLSTAFGGADAEAPTVYAPKNLQAYGHNGAVHEEWHVEYWTVGYPKKTPITGKPLVAEFKAKYPGVTVDWDKEVPKGHKKHTTYDGGVDAQYTKLPKDANDTKGHAALLKALGKGADWKSWKATSQKSTVKGNTVTTDFEYSWEKADGTSGTQSFAIDNPLIPSTAAEKDAYVKAEVGTEYPRFSWTVTVTDPGGKVGDTVAAKVDYLGEREFIRVERDLLDASKNKMDPSRTDATNYGSYAPPPPPKSGTTPP